MSFSIKVLEEFIVRAKATSYVGSGKEVQSCRVGAHDLSFEEGNFSYLDSYFGGTAFIGEEVVYWHGTAVWGMNYYGRVLDNEKISGALAGKVIKASLSKMYLENRFLGGFEYHFEGFCYVDTNQGNTESFIGKEWISQDDKAVYELVYHGGMIV